MQDEILELERLHGTPGEWQGIYTLGQKSQARYLTVKSQQRRAMALADRLGALWRRSPHGKQAPRVAIIGGGVGGLTLASYLAEQSFAAKFGHGALAQPMRWDVLVFERQNQLVPMQRGCAIRKLHPAIHTWPASSCFDLPLLTQTLGPTGLPPTLTDWRAANAGDMAASLVLQVLSNYRAAWKAKLNWSMLQSAEVKVSLDDSGLAPYRLTAEQARRIDPSRVDVVPDTGPWRADIVVFATGFGVEVPGADDKLRLSYWRNDDLGQAPLYGQKQRFVISGAGDGGLTDLFRLCLYDFSYDEVMRELLPVKDADIDAAFAEAVRRVHPNSKASEALRRDLASQYKRLLRDLAKAAPADVCDLLDGVWQGKVVGKKKVDGQSLGYLAHAFLRARCKEGVDVLLQVLPEFAQQDASGNPLRALVNNPKAMLYNRVLAYLLWHMHKFKAKAAAEPNQLIRSEKWQPGSVTTIARRGAQWPEAVLASLAGVLLADVQKVLGAMPAAAVPGSALVEAYRLGQV
ncbi:hypothetical protein [Variovorax sp. HJSM1_2]|uniref:hypothetical protein n=1 Tax=Variovorax sp. HJSM1_2 TaxID=3366263 RepID=UPI003BCDE614